jgi:hypothetical protein
MSPPATLAEPCEALRAGPFDEGARMGLTKAGKFA